FNFNFFGETEHRVFNYKPIYFDPEKEERRRFFGDHGQEGKAGGQEEAANRNAAASAEAANQDTSAQGKAAGEEPYTPGKYIQGSFRDGNYQRLRTSSSTKAQKVIGIVGLVLFFVVLYYIAQFYGLILK
ncbi:MAG: hypothetical protein MJY49_06320, partial [Bacteroidales bacterium]|nr:hypothetical protein [Bacteroidales bacterium]